MIQDPSSPHALRATHPTGSGGARLELTRINGGAEKWWLELAPDQLTLHSPTDPRPFVFPRVEVAEKVQLVVRSLVIKTLPGKLVLRLARKDVQTLSDWIGPPSAEDLNRALKKRFGASLVLGCVLLLVSLPFVQNPASGLAPFSSGLVDFALGSLMVTTWAIARFIPHRICFLLESMWFLLLGLGTALRMARGGSWWWLVLIVATLFFAMAAFSQYRRFAGTSRPAPSSASKLLQ